MRSKAALGLLGLGLLVVASAALGAAVGSTVIDLPAALWELLDGEAASPDARILLHVRLPRVCASLLCGSALAVSGMLIQAVLSNPLASPNVIGVNAGAGFCTFLAMALAPGMAGAAPLGAFIGALSATLIVYAVAAGAGAGKLTIILAGVAVSSIFTAGTNTIKTFFPDTLYNGSTFLIGGFSGVSFANLSPAWLMILPALALACLLARPTDVLCLGEETAHSLGLPVKAIRFGLILIACVLVLDRYPSVGDHSAVSVYIVVIIIIFDQLVCYHLAVIAKIEPVISGFSPLVCYALAISVIVIPCSVFLCPACCCKSCQGSAHS